MRCLLDTCTFLWLAAEPVRLSPQAETALNDASNSIFLSDVSIWEIVLKCRAGKLAIPEIPRVWIPKQVNFFQLRRQAIDAESLFLSGELADLHRDPFDRLLCAQAIAHGLTVLTPDPPFRKLGATTVW